MKTGVLNRTYSKVKNFCKRQKDPIKNITKILCIVIAVIIFTSLVNNIYGGLKEIYSYREYVYQNLETVLEENIVNDPYIDLKKIDTTELNYTCTYNNEKQSWEVQLSEAYRRVNAYIVYIDDKLEMEVTYLSKVEYFIRITISCIVIVVFVAIWVYVLLLLVFVITWALFKLICLLEKLIIFLKNKFVKTKTTTT